MAFAAANASPSNSWGQLMERLKHRREFLSAAKAAAWRTRSVIVQASKREDGQPARVGFTVTRKIGNAVIRNRVRRRIKEAVRLTPAERFNAGCDYVFIARQGGKNTEFSDLCSEIDLALCKLNSGQTNHTFQKRGAGRKAANS